MPPPQKNVHLNTCFVNTCFGAFCIERYSFVRVLARKMNFPPEVVIW